MIPTPQLELAILRFPLREYLAPHRPRLVGRAEQLLSCPRCWRDKLAVNVEKKVWRCFTCPGEPGGDVVGLIMLLEELTFRQAIERVLSASRPTTIHDNVLPPPRFGEEEDAAEAPRQPTGLPENCLAVDAILPYMSRRGIDLVDARTYGLGYCTTGWLANRLVFPIWENGQCVYWQARAMWDESEHVPCPRSRRDGSIDPDKFTKTLNPARERKGVHFLGSGDVLLNLHQAKEHPRVALTEGPTSCVRTGPSAVATFGKQLQPQQITRLIQAGVSAVDFMWDGPSPKEPLGAWPAMIKCASSLSPFMDVRLVFLPAGDPGDYSRSDLENIRSFARPLASVGNTL